MIYHTMLWFSLIAVGCGDGDSTIDALSVDDTSECIANLPDWQEIGLLDLAIPQIGLHPQDARLDTDKERLYVTGRPGLWVVDISDPATPTATIAVRTDPDIAFLGIEMSADMQILRTTDEAGITWVIDVSEEVIRVINTYASGEIPDLIRPVRTGGYLFTPEYGDGVAVTFNGQHIKTIPTWGSSVDVEAADGFVSISDTHGVTVVNTVDLTVTAHIETPRYAMAADLDVETGILWVADWTDIRSYSVNLNPVPVAWVGPVNDDTVEIGNVGALPLTVASQEETYSLGTDEYTVMGIPTTGCVTTNDPSSGVIDTTVTSEYPVGTLAPTVEVTDSTGDRIEINPVGENPLLVVFWASW